MSDKYPGGFVTANAPAGYSVAFDGTGDYLTTPSSSAFNLSSGDWTIEGWLYLTSNSDDTRFFSVVNSSTDMYGSYIRSGRVYFGQIGVGEAQFGAVSLNTWNHIAFCRTSTSTVTCYINGVSTGTTTTYTLPNANCTVYIAATPANYALATTNGYISNFRLVKGTALYTTTFTPPTQLFPVTNTQLLICQSPTLIDNSTNNFTITAVGNAAPSNFTPFAAYQGFNPALGAAAGGVWTLDEAAYYQNNRQWPIYDPYFNQTTLMLHGNGTNGAQNNTFLDSSANNFTITRNGNTTQGSFTPFSQTGWSTYFNGSSQGIVIPSSTFSGSWVNSNFTFETWVYVTGNGPNGFAWFYGQNNNDCLYLGLDITNRNIYYGSFNGISFNYSYTTSNNIWQKDQWMHIAWVRNSTTSNTGGMKIFLNGVMVGQGNTGTFGTFDNSFFFNNAYNPWADFDGYCAGLRLTNRALYSSNFTPERLTNVTGTQVLLCTDNTITDASLNKYPLSITGTPTIRAFSPFVPAYITPTTYSNLFTGTGSTARQISTVANANLAFGTGDITFECWINTLSTNNMGMWGTTNEAAWTSSSYAFNYSNGTIVLWNNTALWTISVGTLHDGGWHHVAIVRSSGTWQVFADGVSKGTTTTEGSRSLGDNTWRVGIGAVEPSGADSHFWIGAISNMRVSNTAIYTANFTPATAPLTTTSQGVSSSNVKFLSCQSSTFIDNSINAVTLTAINSSAGFPGITTTPTPFPAKVDTTTLNSAYSTSLIGGSAYFDGTDDYLLSQSTTAFNLGTGDFCIEMWFYWTGSGNGYYGLCGSQTDYKIAMSLYNQKIMYGASSNGSSWNILAAESSVGSTTIIPNMWTHLVLCRTGTTISGFVNGKRDITITSSASIVSRTEGYVSGSWYASLYRFLGYISNFRFIVGSNPYNANSTGFAPPLTPPTAVTNTQLLLNYTNGAIFDNTAKNVVETVSGASLSTAQVKYGTTSMAFNGSSDYVVTPSSKLISAWSGDCTIEGWYYTTSIASTPPLWMNSTSNSDGMSGGYVYSDGRVGMGKIGVSDLYSAVGLWSNNRWNHVAYVKAGATAYIFLNGVLVASGTATTYFETSTVKPITLGRNYQNSPSYYTGYINDFRITQGVARYVANFTPPTSALQNQ